MKRFWREVTVRGDGVLLDGRPLRTPARVPLRAPPRLAEAIAEEWRAAAIDFDPRSLPLTGLTNAAIDRADTALADSLAAYAETDLLCYRADDPALAAAEAAAWDPLLDWARTRYDASFVVTAGIVHAPQPPATVARLAAAVGALDRFRLAALSPLVTIGGSLVAAFGVIEGAFEAEATFAACHLDELWQAERWGEDALAADTRARRRADFITAAAFVALLPTA